MPTTHCQVTHCNCASAVQSVPASTLLSGSAHLWKHFTQPPPPAGATKCRRIRICKCHQTCHPELYSIMKQIRETRLQPRTRPTAESQTTAVPLPTASNSSAIPLSTEENIVALDPLLQGFEAQYAIVHKHTVCRVCKLHPCLCYLQLNQAICKVCPQAQHTTAVCPKRKCAACHELGHSQGHLTCSARPCLHCGESLRHHSEKDCSFKPCTTCKLVHPKKVCPLYQCPYCQVHRSQWSANHSSPFQCDQRICSVCKVHKSQLSSTHTQATCEKATCNCGVGGHHYKRDCMHLQCPSCMCLRMDWSPTHTIAKCMQEHCDCGCGSYKRKCPNRQCPICKVRTEHLKRGHSLRACLHTTCPCGEEKHHLQTTCKKLQRHCPHCNTDGKTLDHIRVCNSKDSTSGILPTHTQATWQRPTCPHEQCDNKAPHDPRRCPQRACLRCNQAPWHSHKHCKCSLCGGPFHSRTRCPQRACRQCKQAPWHSLAQCKCVTCGAPYHPSKDCPEFKQLCKHCNANGMTLAHITRCDQRPCPCFVAPSHVVAACTSACPHKDCTNNEPHNAASCPQRPCLQCKQTPWHKRSLCQCTLCKGPFHAMAQCPQNICGHCGSHGHQEEQCPHQPCMNCDSTMHVARDCPRKPCAQCGSDTHSTRLCTRGPRFQTGLTPTDHDDGAHHYLDKVVPHELGKRETCEHCLAQMWPEERISGVKGHYKCCKKGKVRLDPLTKPHKNLKQLYTASTPEAKLFRDNIRSFNNNFAFTSTAAQVAQAPHGSGPMSYKIKGMMSHHIGPLEPDGETPAFAQLHVIGDEDEEVQQRLAAWSERNKKQHKTHSKDKLDNLEKIMIKLVTAMRRNPVRKTFRHAYEILKDGRDIDLCIEADAALRPTGAHPRTYNQPTVPEVAVVIEEKSAERAKRNMRLYTRNDQTPIQTIDETHSAMDAASYPLFHDTGQLGWGLGLTTTSGDKLTQKDFYTYRAMTRSNSDNILQHGRRLWQQYLVDQFAKIEQSRLRWIRMNQKEIRAETYSRFQESLDRNDNLSNVGRRVILPASVYGSPRYLNQMYQNAMAIVRKLGKPHLFVTFTCNPDWKEIQHALLPGQTAVDRPDLTARVFKLKLDAMLADITEDGIFGRVLSKIWVVEFQKRGLPHAHMLFILHPDDAPRTTDDYNKFVCAELPSHPVLRRIIEKQNTHGPCHRKPCWDSEQAKCTKGFPKTYGTNTMDSQSGYPLYRRRSQAQGGDDHNNYIVPFNPYLSLKYNAHINVEICASVAAVKYLYKGPDRAVVRMTQNTSDPIDEIVNYTNCRYIGPSEAVFRLMEFDLYHMTPVVTPLPVHLEGQRYVLFDPTEDNKVDDTSNSMLDAWFQANKNYPEAHNIHYQDFPSHFVWHQKLREWQPRKRYDRTTTIGRMVMSNVKQGERFYLRKLLLRVKGAANWDDLRRDPEDSNLIHPTYKAACLARGLMTNDDIWRETMQEAVSYSMDGAMRALFITLLVECSLADPLALFQEFAHHMCNDIARKLKCSVHNKQAQDSLLLTLQNQLTVHNKTLSDFDLPQPSADAYHVHGAENEQLLREERAMYPIDQEAHLFEAAYEKQSAEQQSIVDEIDYAVTHPHAKHRCFFVDGPGGCGKTFLFNSILHQARSKSAVCLPVASSGIAGTLLFGGTTAHKRFALPLELDENSTSSISLSSGQARLLKEAKLILWDEISMASKYGLHVLDQLLRDVKQSNKPFGGIVLVLGGDFRQCCPVIAHSLADRKYILSTPLPEDTMFSTEHKVTTPPSNNNHSSQPGNAITTRRPAGLPTSSPPVAPTTKNTLSNPPHKPAVLPNEPSSSSTPNASTFVTPASQTPLPKRKISSSSNSATSSTLLSQRPVNRPTRKQKHTSPYWMVNKN